MSTGLGKDSWQNNDTSAVVGTNLDMGGLYVNDRKLGYNKDTARYYLITMGFSLVVSMLTS